MRVTHPCSWQTWHLAPLALALAACATEVEQDSIWPPADFRIEVEESSLGELGQQTGRRFLARADGIVVYGIATDALVDIESGTALPIYGSVAIYELRPICTRALARRVYRAGVLDLQEMQGQREGEVKFGTAVRWRAFERSATLTSRGRVYGGMAEILAIVGAHLPAGEQFATPGVAERGIAPVLRGVPELRDDQVGALAALLTIQETKGADRDLLLDSYALACSLGRRAQAEELLARWMQLAKAQAEAGEAASVSDVTFRIYSRMLPAGG